MASRNNTAGTTKDAAAGATVKSSGAKTNKQTAAKTQDVETAAVTTGEPVRKTVKQEIDIHQYIPVKNGFQGKLVYVSRRTGENFQWDSFGEEQEMELQELKNAKSSDKAFFQNNWFMFDDEYAWVPDYLGVGNFYRNSMKEEEFESIFLKSPDEIHEIVSKLPNGQKVSLTYLAQRKIAETELDSNKAIAALEESLGVTLVER